MDSMKYIHKRLLERHFIEMKTHDWLSEPTPLRPVALQYYLLMQTVTWYDAVPMTLEMLEKKETMQNRKNATEN